NVIEHTNTQDWRSFPRSMSLLLDNIDVPPIPRRCCWNFRGIFCAKVITAPTPAHRGEDTNRELAQLFSKLSYVQCRQEQCNFALRCWRVETCVRDTVARRIGRCR